MNGGATVSPLFVPNLCCCGHDYRAHNLTTSPGTCSLCAGGTSHNHDFTGASEIAPAKVFPETLPVGFVSPGGFGTYFTIVSTSGNPAGSTTIIFGNVDSRVQPGMTFTSLPSNLANQATYTIRKVDTVTNQITIDPPGLLFNLGTVRCVFQGQDGSTMGAGLPPNGQRAG
jgi:hypothetical protein